MYICICICIYTYIHMYTYTNNMDDLLPSAPMITVTEEAFAVGFAALTDLSPDSARGWRWVAQPGVRWEIRDKNPWGHRF